ncbi:MAG: UDP-N-acetylmuramate dehydrogenase [Acidimicrobiales bacterium]|jgi:UDP-N-acetylmuramate dehydrogenase
MSWCSATTAALDLLGVVVQTDRDLSEFTTYRVGGPAAGFVDVSTVEQLAEVGAAIRSTGAQVLVVGKGSNLLVADGGFDGVALRLSDGFANVEIGEPHEDQAGVRCGAASLLPVVARKTALAGLTGFEWAVGVPGSVGGAVRMNAGGHGSDMSASLQRVSLFDLYSGVAKECTVGQLELGYRSSAVAENHVVLWADLVLQLGDRRKSEEQLHEIVRWRREHQPGGQNAGSVFANPPGDSAGRLIEQAGLSGHRLGTAEVSAKHANFIQADDDGSADDVFDLITLIQSTVEKQFGIRLKPENRLVGFSRIESRP